MDTNTDTGHIHRHENGHEHVYEARIQTRKNTRHRHGGHMTRTRDTDTRHNKIQKKGHDTRHEHRRGHVTRTLGTDMITDTGHECRTRNTRKLKKKHTDIDTDGNTGHARL